MRELIANMLLAIGMVLVLTACSAKPTMKPGPWILPADAKLVCFEGRWTLYSRNIHFWTMFDVRCYEA